MSCSLCTTYEYCDCYLKDNLEETYSDALGTPEDVVKALQGLRAVFSAARYGVEFSSEDKADAYYTIYRAEITIKKLIDEYDSAMTEIRERYGDLT